MAAKNAHVTAGDSYQKQTSNIKIGSPRPIITPKEARRILGSESKNLSNKELYRVIIQMERLAVLLANNPEFFNVINGEKVNE